MIRCPTCTSEVPVESSFCGKCGNDVRVSDATTQTSLGSGPPVSRSFSPGSPTSSTNAGIGRLSSSDTLGDARFLPGTMIDERYRVIGLLGKGGMGEVYRADDLKLGVPVALKFLPERLERDEGRLQRFLNEVRVARQVSHANVCRVYDIGEFRGQHYLSMEYVDGEDLASLLRRIGRLGDDKALEIARQICAGLAAAHAKGIIHRDLKPGNVMIDGSGQVRITDFGLAGLAEGFQGAEIRVGTPAYMSPEQIAGLEVTFKSDVYSLGLVLYELFTGKAAFSAPTLAELSRQQQETMPSTPSTLVSGFDPAVERVILRCLEKNAGKRPASALAVASALPGGDPLAAALAAGETPSPEMVAAAGGEGGLNPLSGLGYLAVILAGLGILVALSSQFVWPRQHELAKPPQALLVESHDLIAELGYDEHVGDRMYGYSGDDDYVDYVRREDQSPDRWETIDTVRPSPLVFWYRQSPESLVPLRASGSASFENPPMQTSGMLRLTLDTDGRLLGFLAVPPQKTDAESEFTEADWSPLLEAAGLDETLLAATEPRWHPLVESEHRVAWEGTYPNQPDVPIRIEAGWFGSRPVFFEVIAPWTRPERMPSEADNDTGQTVAGAIQFTLLMLFLGMGGWLAWRNLKKGRGDKRGAYVMASYISFLVMGAWAFQAHHVLDGGEIGMFFNALQGAVFASGMVWLFYVALEPYVRRLWPHALISWSRLLGGGVRDPLVGRDLLVGSAGGVVIAVALALGQLVPGWMGRPALAPIGASIATLTGIRRVAGLLLQFQTAAMISPIFVFFLILAVRLIVKKQWIAVGVSLVLMTLVQGLSSATEPLGWILSAGIWMLIIWIMVRRGLLPAVFTFVYANLLISLPLTSDFSAWYAGRAWFGVGVLAAVALYGFYISSLAGRTVFADVLLEQT
jgi:predicted Ser/Thr protein kinase